LLANNPIRYDSKMTLEEEQRAFEAQLDSLRAGHEGQFVLFKDGAPADFFEGHAAAFRAGIERFGLEAAFLVAEVTKIRPTPISVSWQLGIMFAD